MAIQPLNQGDVYYDPVLNAVLKADGTLSIHNAHQMTMLWPSYSAIDLADPMILRLMPAVYDLWTNILEYYDSNLCMHIRMDLATGKPVAHQTTSTSTSTSSSVPPPSQQNWGWTEKYEEKKPIQIKTSFPYRINAVLFHKTSRTKWIFSEIDSMTNHPVLRSFYDKSQAMQIFEKDYEEFEEIFF
jgi:hypothetical protein